MVCPYSLSVPGGVQAQVLSLTRELRRTGVEVRVLAPCDGPPPDTFVTPLGNSLPTAANGSIAPLAPDPSAQLRTIRALTDEAFDVLHLHEPFTPGPTQTAVVMATAPIVATFHAAGDSLSYRYLRRPVVAAAARIAHRVAVSKDARDLAHRYLGGEYEVLYNGVDLGAYRSASPWPAERPAVFFLGRHEERKGLDVLLAAVEQMTADIDVWVAGTGPDTEALRARHAADSRIQWLGRIDDDEKYRRLAAASVFCAPSLRGESFGVVLVEAMAAGAAVVASGLDGYRNVATDRVDALLVPPGDIDALVGALTEVLAAPSLRARLVDGGRARSEDFSMVALAQRYRELYHQLAETSPPGSSSGPSHRAGVVQRGIGRLRGAFALPGGAADR